MLFSAAESAFLSINTLRVLVLKKNRRALRVAALLEHRDRLLNTFLIGNNLVNIALTSFTTMLAMRLWGNVGIVVAVAASTVFLLVVGEIIPKTIGTRCPEVTAFALAPAISFFAILFSPVARCFTGIARFLARLLGISLKKTPASFTEEEIKNWIELGEEEGVLASGEKRMMRRVFAFTDLAARDVMVPRVKMFTVSYGITWEAVLALAERTRLWRFPVCGDGGIDDIRGVLYMQDLLPFADRPTEFSVKKVMREAMFVPATKKMSAVQRTLRENRQGMAIVLDEYFGTSGLLTARDIARTIFGETL
jgi:CBS domain containing-hemolysin-like protein